MAKLNSERPRVFKKPEKISRTNFEKKNSDLPQNTEEFVEQVDQLKKKFDFDLFRELTDFQMYFKNLQQKRRDIRNG